MFAKMKPITFDFPIEQTCFDSRKQKKNFQILLSCPFH